MLGTVDARLLASVIVTGSAMAHDESCAATENGAAESITASRIVIFLDEIYIVNYRS